MSASTRLFFFLLLWALSEIAAALGPDPSQIKISHFSFDGALCPAASASGLIQDGGDSLTLLFDEFFVENHREPSVAGSCQVKMDLAARGWQFAMFSFDLRGYASLDSGSRASVVTSYRIGNNPSVNIGKVKLSGALEDDYSEIADIPLSSLNWSKCGGTKSVRLLMKIRIRGNDRSGGFLSVDSVDGALNNQVGVIWRNCEPRKRKKYVAFCKVKRTWSRNNRPRSGWIEVYAKANKETKALSKAQQKSHKKCHKRVAKRGGHCGVPQCAVERLDASSLD